MIPLPSHTLPRTEFPLAEGSMQAFEHLLDFRTFTSLRRMVGYQQSKPLIKRCDFIKQVTLYLPEVAARIEESDFGVVHLEVGALKLATQDAFARSDFAAVRKQLHLVADLFDRADDELYEAIRVSWLEALFLGETSAAHIAARGMLSKPMENVLRQSELRLEKQRSAAK
ncbi:MAG: hypothetical protein KJ795_03260 [Gammaproteobacteria bacterium]|nr:hypothetical protein [Gammaproteobacteria bacterium]MBU1776794.1 hypothetical protein [Gammaproteobacteria bacterium]MBU1967788.1 hypothetical protein [Gammaproteobacteria bacterium]